MNNNDPLDILARTVWGEARGEGTIGMAAVANVVINRVAKPCWWGNDIVSVCQKPWQFSCWNKNDPNLPKLIVVNESDPYFLQANTLASKAVNKDLADNTNGATSYYDKRMPNTPKWALGKTPCVEIGHHLFFKDV